MSRLLIVKSSPNGEACYSHQLLTEFVRQSLLKWPSTELITWDLTQQTALSASVSLGTLQSADYLAFALCSEDYSCLLKWLDDLLLSDVLLPAKKSAPTPLFIFVAGESEAANLAAKSKLAQPLFRLGLVVSDYIEVDGSKQSEDDAHRRIEALMNC